MTGKCPDELDGPECPFELQYLWGIYLEITRTRQGGFGPQAITYQEIASWSHLFRTRLAPWEVRTLVTLDQVSLTEVMPKRPSK